jgi:hypothetical protein
MAVATLKSLHTYLRLLENSAELKRRMPSSSNQRTLKDGLSEISTLVGLDNAAFEDPQNIAAVIGPQRFVMIQGEPSLGDRVARAFDNTRVLLMVLIDPMHFDRPASSQLGTTSGGALQQAAARNPSPDWAQPKTEPIAAQAKPRAEQETALDSLKPFLSGNMPLTCRLFRALFEHMLGCASQSGVQQGSASLVNELTGSKEHGRSFLSTALFILGAEVDHDNLVSFMMEQGGFGMLIFEHLLQNREYCEAYYAFRRLERAFMGSPAEEETQLRNSLDKFNARFGGKPCSAKILEADAPDKARVDAHRAAVDVLEAMAFTPYSMSLDHAIAATSSNSVRSIKTIARHFERFADGGITKEQANQEIADHLLAFARQFSADSDVAQIPAA